MITLIFKHSLKRSSAHFSMTMVADDVKHWIKVLNLRNKTDHELPVPEDQLNENKIARGIANETGLWFGFPKDQLSVMDIDIFNEVTLPFITEGWYNTLIKLTILSICEQFPHARFSTDEDFTEAIEIYESEVGSISYSAEKCL